MSYDLKTLGQTVRRFQGFDTFPAPANVTRVSMESDELTGMCPITEQPDWYSIKIDYVPDKHCLESKTLKLYLQKFRNDGIFGESLAGQIADDIFDALQPHLVEIVLIQKPRGGISITSFSKRKKVAE